MTEERRNLYRILHVQPEAPLEVIRASYRTLMSTLRAHPDLGGDAQVAAGINHAYAVLTDPQRRHAYDKSLKLPWVGRTAAAAAVEAAVRPADVVPTALDAVTWQADRACPFCRRPLPAVVHGHALRGCDSPLFRRPSMDRGELFGRRGSPAQRTRHGGHLAVACTPGRPRGTAA
jgi:curved DNA-binding protein CbpA